MQGKIEFAGGNDEAETVAAAKQALGDNYEKIIEDMPQILDQGGCGYIPGFMLLDIVSRLFPDAKEESKKAVPSLMHSGYFYIRGTRVAVVFSEAVSPETLKAIFPRVCYLSITRDAGDGPKAKDLRPKKITVRQLEEIADDFADGAFSFAFRPREGALENATEFLTEMCGAEAVGTRGTDGCDYVLVSAFTDDSAVMTGISEDVLLQSEYVLDTVYEVDFSDAGLLTSIMAEKD